METYMFPLKTFDCFWRETSKGIIEKEVLTMSKKAQEVRQRRLESMAYLKKGAEIAFDFVLNEFDEKTGKGDYTPVHLFLTWEGVPSTVIGNYGKRCDDVEIGRTYHEMFFEMLEKMFNDEEGYTAKFIDGNDDRVSKLIVQIDFV